MLWLFLFILSGVISPLFSSSILGIYWPGELIFQCHIFLPFHTVHGVLKARILKWFAIPFSSGPCFVELSTMTCPYWVALYSIAHSFIELDNRRRQWHPTPVLLPGKSHGWRSLEGCSPWGHWGLDRTDGLHFHFSISCIGEENGNPLQCSCLENPRDGEAWWAAICGVAQSRTRLKWLSSSSSSGPWDQFD